eukprot:TRINITY_DN720_c0_g1_i3.p1 TRINITY_DN720_c0_g1~~TRINITY_DN720_c0_g1_i3.p1  ORF type:complete len:453 (+),score=94.59 TRINITY_DN720_c0_g1_i3:183-1541(+)
MARSIGSEGEELLPGGAKQAGSTAMAMGFAGSVTGIVLVCGAMFFLKPLFSGSSNDHRVKLGAVDIDIDKQNGVTSDLDVGIVVTNDMSDSLHDNSGAYSDKGDVKRINGAYDNNAESESGNVIRVNGVMDNNAQSETGDVTRSNGVLLTKKGHEWITDKSLGDSVAQRLGITDNSSGLPTINSSFADTSQFLSNSHKHAGYRQNYIQNSSFAEFYSQFLAEMQLAQQNKTAAMEEAIAAYVGFEEAKAEQRNQDIIKILNWLYGPFGNNTTDSGMDESSMDAKAMAAIEHDLMDNVVKGTGEQSKTVNNAVNKFFMPKTNSTRMNNATSDKPFTLSVHKIDDLVAGLTKNKLKRDVDIDNVRIKIKKQNGLQANVEAGIKVKNSMPHTLTHNNVARSKGGDVWRFNGIYDNNAGSKTAEVLRVNGAYDNNAKSKNGSVVRNNGIVVADDNQ